MSVDMHVNNDRRKMDNVVMQVLQILPTKAQSSYPSYQLFLFPEVFLLTALVHEMNRVYLYS